jgi:hypothetical protein
MSAAPPFNPAPPFLDDEVVVERQNYRLTISASEAAVLRLSQRREVSRSRDEIVNTLDEIDIAAADVSVVMEAMWRCYCARLRNREA